MTPSLIFLHGIAGFTHVPGSLAQFCQVQETTESSHQPVEAETYSPHMQIRKKQPNWTLGKYEEEHIFGN